MNHPAVRKNLYTQLIYRPFWITVTSLLVILTIALVVLINTGWHAFHQAEPLKIHLALTDALQDYNAKLDKPATEYSSQQLTSLQQALTDTLQNASKIISDEARASLQLALDTLQETQTGTQADLSLVQKKIRAALHTETGIQTRLLHRLV
ncbi:MAG: hypothetical protein GXP18_04125 [Gammaproteobacteria bacterium]|nr:hypothetical protein [Gammaproteobacteria bacterium]